MGNGDEEYKRIKGIADMGFSRGTTWNEWRTKNREASQKWHGQNTPRPKDTTPPEFPATVNPVPAVGSIWGAIRGELHALRTESANAPFGQMVGKAGRAASRTAARLNQKVSGGVGAFGEFFGGPNDIVGRAGRTAEKYWGDMADGDVTARRKEQAGVATPTVKVDQGTESKAMQPVKAPTEKVGDMYKEPAAKVGEDAYKTAKKGPSKKRLEQAGLIEVIRGTDLSYVNPKFAPAEFRTREEAIKGRADKSTDVDYAKIAQKERESIREQEGATKRALIEAKKPKFTTEEDADGNKKTYIHDDKGSRPVRVKEIADLRTERKTAINDPESAFEFAARVADMDAKAHQRIFADISLEEEAAWVKIFERFAKAGLSYK